MESKNGIGIGDAYLYQRRDDDTGRKAGSSSNHVRDPSRENALRADALAKGPLSGEMLTGLKRKQGMERPKGSTYWNRTIRCGLSGGGSQALSKGSMLTRQEVLQGRRGKKPANIKPENERNGDWVGWE